MFTSYSISLVSHPFNHITIISISRFEFNLISHLFKSITSIVSQALMFNEHRSILKIIDTKGGEESNSLSAYPFLEWKS